MVWLHWTKETCKASSLYNGSSCVCCQAVVPGVLACVHMYILYVCVYICVCVYACGHVHIFIYACVYVLVHLCVYTRVNVYVYAYWCIDCVSWYQGFSAWTVSCMRICFRVHMYAYTYVCGYIYMCIFLQWVLRALYRFFRHWCMGKCVCYTGVFSHQRTHLRTHWHSLQVMHICVYVYMCVYACICIWMRMCVYDIAWHVEVLLLRFSICAYVRICMRMYRCVHVCVYMCMRICMYICMYTHPPPVGVCMLLCAYTYIKYLSTWCKPRCGTDTWRARRTQWPKRNIHVDRIGVHRIFVYIYAVLRVLMVWANCFFLLTCLFF